MRKLNTIIITGDLVHLNVLGMHIVVVNSQKIAIDLMEKRSKIYSDRPYLAMAGDLCAHYYRVFCLSDV